MGSVIWVVLRLVSVENTEDVNSYNQKHYNEKYLDSILDYEHFGFTVVHFHLLLLLFNLKRPPFTRFQVWTSTYRLLLIIIIKSLTWLTRWLAWFLAYSLWTFIQLILLRVFLSQCGCSLNFIEVSLMFFRLECLGLDHGGKHRFILLLNYVHRFQSLSLVGFNQVGITGSFITLLDNIAQHWGFLSVVKFIIQSFSVVEELLRDLSRHVNSFRTRYPDLRLS